MHEQLWDTNSRGKVKLRTQQIVDVPVAEAAAHMRDLHDLLVQLHSSLIGLRRMAVTVAGESHKTARAAFGQMVFAHHFSGNYGDVASREAKYGRWIIFFCACLHLTKT